MKIFNGLFAASLLLVALAAEARAASCAISVKREFLAQANAMQSVGRACERESKRRSINIARACAVCGPLAAKLSRFERYARRHRECFITYSDKRLLRELAAARPMMQFVRRGCGY